MTQRSEIHAADRDAATLAEPRPGGRRAYRSPSLECHGRLAEMTRFGGSDIVDSGSGLGVEP